VRSLNKVQLIGRLGADPETRYMPSGSAVTNLRIATSEDDCAVEAFWSKVAISDDANACWPWRGAKKPSGYGNVRINCKWLNAHRVAFELGTGIAIPRGLVVLHLCDNPSCCNPRHLVLGTSAANYADMVIKQRQGVIKNKALGEKNHNAKLTREQVKMIRELYARKELNQYQLAERFGVTQSCIGSIVRRQAWRHV